jgi:hypothetical protein
MRWQPYPGLSLPSPIASLVASPPAYVEPEIEKLTDWGFASIGSTSKTQPIANSDGKFLLKNENRFRFQAE